MYVQRFIYTKVYVIPIARTYIKVWGGIYIGGVWVGQSARRLCTLFNFQRLPQYTNSRVVYKGLYVGVPYVYRGMLIYLLYICMCKGLYTYYICVCAKVYI